VKGDVFPTRVMKAYRRNGGTDPLILNLVGGEVHAPAALLRKIFRSLLNGNLETVWAFWCTDRYRF